MQVVTVFTIRHPHTATVGDGTYTLFDGDVNSDQFVSAGRKDSLVVALNGWAQQDSIHMADSASDTIRFNDKKDLTTSCQHALCGVYE